MNNAPPPLSQANQQLIQLDEAILNCTPKQQEEFRTVQERLRFLLASYPSMAPLAITRCCLETIVLKEKS